MAKRLPGLNAAGEACGFCRNRVQLGSGQVAAAGKTVGAGDYRGSEFCLTCFARPRVFPRATLGDGCSPSKDGTVRV